MEEMLKEKWNRMLCFSQVFFIDCFRDFIIYSNNLLFWSIFASIIFSLKNLEILTELNMKLWSKECRSSGQNVINQRPSDRNQVYNCSGSQDLLFLFFLLFEKTSWEMKENLCLEHFKIDRYVYSNRIHITHAMLFLGHTQLIYHLKNSLFTPFSIKIHRILFLFFFKGASSVS